MAKVCILTTVHSPFDVRIFHKQAKSLVRAGYDITMIAQHDKDEVVDGVKILALKKPRNRLERLVKTTSAAYRKALLVDADIYHFHDPELIPVGLKLRRQGKMVIYDVHEDYYESIKLKSWLPALIRYGVAGLFSKYEMASSRKFNLVITATRALERKFKAVQCSAKWISNYPIKEEFYVDLKEHHAANHKVCFVGGISEIRAIREMVPAAYLAGTPLILAGEFESKALYEEMESKPDWSVVEEKGYVDRKGVADIFSESIAGLILYHSHPTAPFSQPNKLFEYMAAGLPVIASNYPLWKEIIENNKCGICVNPLDVEEIARAIKHIASHPEESQKMGANGKKAVAEKYNWAIEEKKLMQIYEELR